MDFRWSAEDEAFREEVHSWLEEHLVGEYATVGAGSGTTDDSHWDVRQAWERELGEAGWVGLGRPTEYGGPGAPITPPPIFNQEDTPGHTTRPINLVRAGHPPPTPKTL